MGRVLRNERRSLQPLSILNGGPPPPSEFPNNVFRNELSTTNPDFGTTSLVYISLQGYIPGTVYSSVDYVEEDKLAIVENAARILRLSSC